MEHILFIKKKDSLLQVCVNFHMLNKVTKKDCYPLLLISNLLDMSWKAQIYLKINLHHVYHLIQIAKGDEWIWYNNIPNVDQDVKVVPECRSELDW